MATPGTRETYKINVALSVGDKPEGGVPLIPVPDPKMAAREILDDYGGQDVSRDRGAPDQLEAEAPNPGAAGGEEDNAALQFSFPRKLWMIVEDDAFKSVRWSDNGDFMIIEKDLFQREVLHRRGAERIFETDTLKSFTRQLNLHGFAKVHPKGSLWKEVTVYRNCNFKRDHPLLLKNIQRRGQVKCSAPPATTARRRAKGKQQEATRRSLRIQQKNAMKEANKMPPVNPLHVTPGPGATQSLTFSSVWPLSSVSGAALEQPPPTQPSMPSREGTSPDVQFHPPASAGMAGAGEPPTGPAVSPDYRSVMTLYDTCYSVLLRTLSAMAPDESPDSEEDSPSEYHCSICERFQRQFEDEQAP
ncbi:heat shock transcription factor, X-linked member 3-like [Dugong dugon]